MQWKYRKYEENKYNQPCNVRLRFHANLHVLIGVLLIHPEWALKQIRTLLVFLGGRRNGSVHGELLPSEQVELNIQGWTATRARKTATFTEPGWGEFQLQHTAYQSAEKRVLRMFSKQDRAVSVILLTY
jgi:hypothetical protein